MARRGQRQGPTLGRIVEAIRLEGIEAWAQALFVQVRRSQRVEDATVAGGRFAASDASAFSQWEKTQGEQGHQRPKRGKRDGERGEGTDAAHPVVVCQGGGGAALWRWGGEVIYPGAGEVTAALRLRDRGGPRLTQGGEGRVGDGVSERRSSGQRLATQRVKGKAIMSWGESRFWQALERLIHAMPPVAPPGRMLQFWAREREA